MHKVYELSQDQESTWPDVGELQTLHVYIGGPPRPSSRGDITAIALLGVLALALFAALCSVAPIRPAWQIQTLRLPAQIVTQTWQASAPITPTGKRTTPASQASGVLTIYNGSFLVQTLPAGFIVTTASGIEIATDQARVIPASNPPAYGIATVPAHAIEAGQAGNIPALAINQPYAPLYLKNLQAFSGGQDARTTIYVTDQDVSAATTIARQQAQAAQSIGLLAWPCTEQITRQALQVTVARSCAYAHYVVPPGEILGVRIAGNTVLVQVRVLRKDHLSFSGRR